jgi:hypothetical protein
VVPQERVPGADQHVAVAPRDRDRVVGDEAVAALDQVEGALALADAALPGQGSPTP